MKHNIPDITQEELAYNLVYERYHYYVNTDNKLTNKVLVDMTKDALERDCKLGPCDHPEWSVNKTFWLDSEVGLNAAKQHVRRYKSFKKLYEEYDPSLSVKDNLTRMKSKGIKIGRSRLFEFKKEYETYILIDAFCRLVDTLCGKTRSVSN